MNFPKVKSTHIYKSKINKPKMVNGTHTKYHKVIKEFETNLYNKLLDLLRMLIKYK